MKSKMRAWAGWTIWVITVALGLAAGAPWAASDPGNDEDARIVFVQGTEIYIVLDMCHSSGLSEVAGRGRIYPSCP